MQREISWPVAVLSLGQTAWFVFAMSIAVLAGVHWAPVIGTFFLSGAAVWVTISGRATRRTEAVGWGATVLVWGLLFKLTDSYKIETDHMVAALVMVIGILASSQRVQEAATRQRWRIMALIWGFAGSGSLLTEAYLKNQFTRFHMAVAAVLVLLVACRILLRLPSPMIQLVHTLILFLIGLPVVDAFTRPSYQLNNSPKAGKQFYSFKAAEKDPGAFSSWWYHFLKQWEALHRALAIPDMEGIVRYKMAPNSETQVFESTISINSLGFRGPEIEWEKGDAYRIVALGESTTFGCTITEDGKPWPRVLEELLTERLDPDRPIEVVNAGVYGFTLEENVRRMKRILPLEPDMIISYHGYNWFPSLIKAIPAPSGKAPPAYRARPLKLLANLEYQLKVRYHRWTRAPKAAPSLPEPEDLMETRYAEAYDKLIRVTKKHDIRLVLANFSMAVNAQSKQEVIEFYRAGFPEVRASIRANRMHTEIVEELEEEHPEVCFVDTHPPMDGKHEKYIDLVHFTQPGRRQMAEIFYSAIKEIVAEELGEPIHQDPVPKITKDPDPKQLSQEA